MPQWSHSERSLLVKLVYYGPALGGKTTNLRTLHGITDPEGLHKLLVLNTSDDRTLFFDLLPFDLGALFGYRIAMKLYTVPGQVRYDTTRKVVLSGADAVVFVADSSRGRETDNRASWDNLRLNLRANRIDPASLPVVVQINKQDLPQAAPPEAVRRWLGLSAGEGIPAVATEGAGVLATFVAAAKAMLERLTERVDPRVRPPISPQEIEEHLTRTFAPFHERRSAIADARGARARETPIVLTGDDLLEESLRASVRLGGDLTAERERVLRLEREAEAMRRLGESLLRVGATFDRRAILDETLEVAGSVLQATTVSVLTIGEDGEPVPTRVWGRAPDPLLASRAGRALAADLIHSVERAIVDDLPSTIGESAEGWESGVPRALLAVPLPGAAPALLAAYAAEPKRTFSEPDLRFLATLASHLAVGLDKARTHEELSRGRERLEQLVAERTAALLRANADLRRLEETRDRLLSGLSHEMRTPLTAIVGAATFLRDYEGSGEERREMLDALLASSRTLDRLVDDLFRVARLRAGTPPARTARADLRSIVRRAVGLVGLSTVSIDAPESLPPVLADEERLVRAIANLLENAVKFSPKNSPVEICLGLADVGARGACDAVALSVLDRGPGVMPEDSERIFAPFEQGGHALTSKPPGIGLGLHEARTIARLHGGELTYRPREGGGSEFRMVIPSAAVPSRGPEAALA